MKTLQGVFIVIFFVVLTNPVEAFTVKGVAVSTTLCIQGKCETNSNNDEVIYEVDEKKSEVIRKAVVNKSIRGSGLSSEGLQADNTVYTTIYDDVVHILSQGKKTGKPDRQRVIKAIGKTGLEDGFETIVIGDDFIHTSRSSSEYFVIYYYKRVKTLQ